MGLQHMSAGVKEAMANPSKVFNAPMDVINTPGLTDAERRAILESWEQEAHLLQTATGENMAGGEPSRIEDVRKAIDALDTRAEVGR
ncbi:MAG: hypothetical protein JNJ53_06305 [Rhizobiales bacterium]|nr:hypothetical protein [Hyphomicrobiales bacterium]